MNIRMLNNGQNLITIGISLTEIGRLKIQGRSHQVIPLEVSPEKLVFLCPWNIPVSPNVRFNYVLADYYDRLTVRGHSLSKEPWRESSLYTATLQASDNERLRITGILNRMIYHHLCETSKPYYNKRGKGVHMDTTSRLKNTLIQ